MADVLVPSDEPGKLCPQKRRYRTRRRALNAMALALKHGKAMRAYKCPFCRDWHLTSRPLKVPGMRVEAS